MSKASSFFQTFVAAAVFLFFGFQLSLGILAFPLAHAQEDTSSVEDELCEDLEGTELLECEGDATTSFTNFEGEFAPPSEEGYAEGITETSSAREFIVNVTNFVLSFLGLAAVVVIVYGGFLYVTAAGEEEQATKGKKSVMYAVIGIVIVLISYALVNTIIGAANEGGDSSGGIYTPGGVSGDTTSALQATEVAEQIKALAKAYVDEYSVYIQVMAILDGMAALDSFDDDALQDLEEGFKMIREEVDGFSNVADTVDDALQLIHETLAFDFSQNLLKLANYEDWFQTNVLLASHCDLAEDPNCEPHTNEGDTAQDDDDTQENDDPEEGDSDGGGDADPYGIGAELIGYMGDIGNDSFDEFKAALKEIQISMGEIQGSFVQLTEINGKFEDIDAALASYQLASEYGTQTYTFDSVPGAKFTLYDTPPGGSQGVGTTFGFFNDLYNLVVNLKFTTAILTANTKEANAPVTITFDGLESFDPTNQTIPDANYEWDLWGDGFYDKDKDKTNDVDINKNVENATDPNVSYTYSYPGTYRAALRVVSNDPDKNIASGISYLSIKVNPPSAIIHLEATTSSSTTPVPLTDLENWTITEEQGKAGVVFDASKTTDGNLNEETILNFEFDFGDGDIVSGPESEVTHYYNVSGSYPFQLEVTDQNGVTDRKKLTIEVSSPAASLEPSLLNIQIGEEVALDASDSVTDNGKIVYYDWTISSSEGESVYKQGGETLDELYYSFEEPGIYTVEVTVTDNPQKTNTAEVTLTVESTPPVASFVYSIPDSNRPQRVYFDASSSYDPDVVDALSYLWTIDGQEGEDYEYVEGTSSLDVQPIVEFKSVREWPVTLTVSDQYDPPLQKTAQMKELVEVTSVLDLSVSTVGEGVIFLNEQGQALVTLELNSENGEAYEVDWSDGGLIQTFSSGLQQATHTYSAAQTYAVKVTVYGEGNGSNALVHNVYVGNGTTPIPVIHATIDDTSDVYDGATVQATRMTQFQFDASESVDVNGEPLPRQNFSWNLGDGTVTSGPTVSYVYEESGIYEVVLTARSNVDPSVSAQATLAVEVHNVPPSIYGITVTPQSEDLITPVQVEVVVNAEDVDGILTNYKFWVYDVKNSTERLDTQITTSNKAFLTINTNGTTGQKITYGFGVEVTDNENNTVSSEEELTTEQIPTLEVENGLNQPPKAQFTVDRVNVLVGESVNFTSTSSDPDGQITQYLWDVEGDGFYNNQPTPVSNLTFVFDKVTPDGIEIRLKVIDEGSASAVSEPVRIFVDSLTENPEAAFNYEVSNLQALFQNNSTADTANGASLASFAWDFDLAVDSNGNGNKEDDVDSTEMNPTHVYKVFGNYAVKLLIEDNEGNVDEVERTVVVEQGNPPQAAFTYKIDTKTVTFTNTSKVDAESGVAIKGYAWDFNLAQDSDGNGTKDDDVDSIEKSPKNVYEEYGSYRVRLTAEDEAGRTDTVDQTFALEEAAALELEAFLTSTPEANPKDGKIHLQGTSGSITFKYDSAGAIGSVKYCIDKNVYFDSNGNGKPNDDCNHSATAPGSYSTDFDKSWGLIVVQLTVTDGDGRTVKVMKEVVFDPESGSVSVLPVSQIEALYILLTALGFTLVGYRFYTAKYKNRG